MAPVSTRVRSAATRILLKLPAAAAEHDVVLRDQVLADAYHLLDLADEIEAVEERLRPLGWRERRAARLDRRLLRRLRTAWARVLAPHAASPQARTMSDRASWL